MTLLDVSVLENFHIAQTFSVINSGSAQCQVSPPSGSGGAPQIGMENGLTPGSNGLLGGTTLAQKKSTVSYDIFENVSKEDYKRARKLMINCVLGTDMSQHFLELGKYKARLVSPDFEPKSQDKDVTLTMMFHLADVSNATKPWEVCRRWTDMLFVEFFNQGDIERQRGQTISYLMDRLTVNTAKS